MTVEPSHPLETQATHAIVIEPEVTRQPSSKALTWIRKRRWFLLFVVAPVALATLYYGLIAADVYTSESRFVIKAPDQKRGQLSTIANLIQTTGLSGGQEQTNEVLEYIRSRDALAQLQKTDNVRARFASPNGDLFSRFPAPFDEGSFEDLYKYYGKMVGARLDNETGTAIVTVKAFNARDAYQLNQRLLGLSEQLVNRLNDRARTRAISEAQRQVDLAAERARNARIALAQYRNTRELIDPAKQATGVIEIANAMIAQRAVLQARLDQMRRVAPANPAIPALQQQVAAISAQIASQDSRVVGSNNGIASNLGEYEGLSVEQQFATENLTVANSALVQARNDAQRQQFYLERVVDPNLPDTPLLPRRLMSIITVAAVAICLYFIGWMLVTGILEHAPED